jgi:hypothetical protein
MYHTKSSKSKMGGGMPKPSKGYSYPCPPAEMRFNDRPIMSTNPMREQFEPTDAQPIRQHKRMGGY